MKVPSLLIAIMMLVTGCVSTAADEPLERLHGIQWKDGNAIILVTSNGCTDSASFDVEQHEADLAVVRVKADRCRRMPFQTWVLLPDLDEKSGRLLNPLGDK